MLTIQGHALFHALNSLSTIDYIAKKDADWVYKDANQIAQVRRHLKALITQLEKLDIRLSIKKAQQLLVYLDLSEKYEPSLIASKISSGLEELRERIEQELEDRTLYYVSPQKASLVSDGAKAFGEKVIDKFPDAIADLSEAAQCLGLSRNTACVFHLMRAMECAIYAVGKKFSATIIDKHDKRLAWGVIISNINEKVEEILPREERDKWSSIVSLLYHVKECWRNSTMHPKQTYTGEEAEAVFSAVKTFMNRLAEEV